MGLFSKELMNRKTLYMSVATDGDNKTISQFIKTVVLCLNKKPTNCWGRQNVAPLKFDPVPSDTVFTNFDKC